MIFAACKLGFARASGLLRTWWPLLVFLVIAALAFSTVREVRRFTNDAREAGKAAQREADLRETLTRKENANAVRTEMRDPSGHARYEQCLRTARTPANCERFLPH